MAETNFDKKIKPIFSYVGTIGAVMAAIAYVIIVITMVFGVAVSHSISQTIIFAVINAVIGLIIMQFLKIQGIDLAKRIEKNQEVLTKYNANRAKQKKLHGLRWFWLTTLTKDILIKCLTLAATTFGIVYIVISASEDYTLLLLALVNLIMFACFGILSLVKAYDFFNDEYIPYIEEKIYETDQERIKAEYEAAEREAKERENIIEREVQRRVDLAKEEFDKQRNDVVYTNRGSDILDTSMGLCIVSDNSEPMVLDSGDLGNSVLGGPVYASGSTTNGADFCAQETSRENKKSEEINVNN